MGKTAVIVILLIAAVVLAVVGLGFFLVFARKERRWKPYRWTPANGDAYGLRRLAAFHSGDLPWFRHLPKPGQGTITKMFAGRRGDRPVVVAEYVYSRAELGHPSARGLVYVAAVRMPGPLPPRRGYCRYGTWFTAGTDLAVYAEGRLAFPFIIDTLDELLGVAAQLTA